MTFRPTKERQRAWIKRYLNDGVCPKDAFEYHQEVPGDTACYDALDWLSRQDDISTLADAWDQCPHIAWLGWMHARMEPNKTDLRRWFRCFKGAVNLVGDDPIDWLQVHHDAISAFERRDCSQRTIEWLIQDLADFIDDVGFTFDHPKLIDSVRAEIPNPWRTKRRKRS